MSDAEEKKKGPSQATLLLQMAKERYRALTGEDGQPYAVRKDGPNVALPLRGNRGLRVQLAKVYADLCQGAVPASAGLTDALTVFTGEAERCDPEPIYLRVAPLPEGPDGLVLDLGTADGGCIVVTSRGWEFKARSPVLFRRTNLTAPLPRPLRPGSLEAIRPLVNVDEDDWHLIVGWMLAAWFADIPHSILGLFGLQGTAKSVTTRMLINLVSPSTAPTRSMPKDLKTWVTGANAAWATGLDNLSYIPEWLSDALCRASTGEGMVDRMLYTDSDVNVIAFRRIVVINGIDVGEIAGDLAERLIRIDLNPVTTRCDEKELWRQYDAAQPHALAALLDLMVQVLGVLPDIEVADAPRMADFAHILAALDKVTGWSTLETYRASADDVQSESLSPFGAALRDFAQQEAEWTGTPTDLHDKLVPRDGEGRPRPPKDWPKVKAMKGRIKRDMPALKVFGIEVDLDQRAADRNRTRLIVITDTRKTGHRDPAPDGGVETSSTSSASSAEQWTGRSDRLWDADNQAPAPNGTLSASSAGLSVPPLPRTTGSSAGPRSSATLSAQSRRSMASADDADDVDDVAPPLSGTDAARSLCPDCREPVDPAAGPAHPGCQAPAGDAA